MKVNFQINSDEMSTDTISRTIGQFKTRYLPRLQNLYNYYCGRQAITLKQPSDVGKPCNKVVVNFCNSIVSNFNGYLTGKGVTYSGDNLDSVLDILNYNDVVSEDNELLRQALIYGRAFEINYIDADSKQRFKVLDSRTCIPVYDATLNEELLYIIRFWEEYNVRDDQTECYVEVYGRASTKYYKSTQGFTSLEFVTEVPNYYNQVPITIFALNEDQTSIFEQIMSLQDAYNELLSGEVDDWDSFCDAYLLLKGMTADDEQLAAMKQNRVLMMDTDCDASYLTKSVSDTQIQNMLTTVEDQIHKISTCPDFTDQSFGTSSGIALRFKLLGFENQARNIETEMTKALQKRIELICSILNMVGGEEVWRDIQIAFNRNLPTDIDSIVNEVNQLRGLVSTETLLGQIPFVKNVDEEMARVAAEKKLSLELYTFKSSDEEVAE